MSKTTKKQLQHSVDLLNEENSSQHDYLMRIKRALKSIDIDILSDEFDEPKPKLKQLDQSVFDGLDEKWRFAAVDRNGKAFLVSRKPTVDSTEWYAGLLADYRLVSDDFDASNWQNSLIERNASKELTGSDLARAMLERGDKWVVCFVAYNEKNIKYFDEPSIVVAHDENGFYVRDSYYSCAVPVNSKGEPLTASEVGL